MLHIDTHAAYKELVHSGAQEKLAESIIRLVDNSRTAELENLVTKQDLEQQISLVRSELKSETKELRSEFKSEINTLRSEVKSDMQDIKTELKAEILESKREARHQLNNAMSNINSNFRTIFIIGGLVSAILVTPVLSSWLRPIIDRLTHNSGYQRAL